MNKILLYERFVVPAVFCLLLLFGWLAHADFGMSWDEKTQYVIGRETYETVFEGYPVSEDSGRRFHGPLIEFILYSAQQLWSFESARDVFVFRHLLSFLIFYGGLIAFYFLCKRLLEDWRLALLGVVLLFCSPRIFAHSFVNTRDVPTLVLFIVSMFTLYRFLEKKTYGSAAVHALACAALLATRITGILLIALTIFGLAVDWKKLNLKKIGLLAGMYLFSTIALTITFWPLLWENPVENFLAAYQNMSNKSGGGFYLGQKTNGNPWHWIPVWLTVTTPLAYTVFFTLGLKSTLQRKHWLILLWFFVPVLSIMVGMGQIFDTWRHVFFVYPAFLIISLAGIECSHRYILHKIQRPYAKYTVPVFLSLYVGTIGLWMMRNHPLQYAYFSVPAAYAAENFERDYWGIAFHAAYKKILALEPGDHIISIAINGGGSINNLNMLTPAERHRITLKDPYNAKYYVDNWRSTDYQAGLTDEVLVDTVQVDGIRLVDIYANPLWKPDPNVKPLDHNRELVFAFGKDFMDPERADGVITRTPMMFVIFNP